MDVKRKSLPGLREKLGIGAHVGTGWQAKIPFEAQMLVVTSMPCGGIGECGVCAVTVRRGWKLACKDGPAFDLSEIA